MEGLWRGNHEIFLDALDVQKWGDAYICVVPFFVQPKHKKVSHVPHTEMLATQATSVGNTEECHS